ncbi:hypothetical protein OC714_01255 [Candidatus Phytoplasma australasiaticum]|uniref:hypothetical protein n=1 Tax=Candidatus Phytoplasma australasiaticum TaxID=2754999 RepID=UPI0030E87996
MKKENELSLGNVVKWGFKAFDKFTDLFPAKFGLKVIGKSVTFTCKFVQGMSKTTLVLREGHRLYHMFIETINENNEHPKMITKEDLEMYSKDINRDLAKLDADYKDYEKKKDDHKLRLNQDNLKNEWKNSEKLNESIKK